MEGWELAWAAGMYARDESEGLVIHSKYTGD